MKPRLLDLFSGGGGATRGYQQAGFYVVGIDINPQPHYCGDEFIQAEITSLEFQMWLASQADDFDAIHASPPCQLYSAANNIHGNTDHPDLIGPTRGLLEAAGVPWVIENVPRAPLRADVTLCGLTFGLGVKRHRLFEASFPLWKPPPCPKGHPGDWVTIFGNTVLERSPQIGRTPKNGPIFRRKHLDTDRGREAMGIDWMNRDELSEAIPPAYTEFIGRQLRDMLDYAKRPKSDTVQGGEL
jgi:DNA (cytosine-5)-methyltransferase 1